MSKNVKDLVNQLLEFEPDTPLEAIQEEIGQLAYEVFFEDQPTVKSVLKEMYSMTQWSEIRDGETGKLAEIEDVQEMFSEQIYSLSELLGIELEG